MDSSDSRTAMIPSSDPASTSSQLDVVLKCQLFTQVITKAVILCKYSRCSDQAAMKTVHQHVFMYSAHIRAWRTIDTTLDHSQKAEKVCQLRVGAWPLIMTQVNARLFSSCAPCNLPRWRFLASRRLARRVFVWRAHQWMLAAARKQAAS